MRFCSGVDIWFTVTTSEYTVVPTVLDLGETTSKEFVNNFSK